MVEQASKIILIEEETEVESVCNTLQGQKMISVDLEGEKLGRKGKISMV